MSAALVLTHSGDRTADYLCDRLGGRVPLLRLDTDALPDDLDASFDRGPRLRAHGREVAPETVRAVWYRPARLSFRFFNGAGNFCCFGAACTCMESRS